MSNLIKVDENGAFYGVFRGYRFRSHHNLLAALDVSLDANTPGGRRNSPLAKVGGAAIEKVLVLQWQHTLGEIVKSIWTEERAWDTINHKKNPEKLACLARQLGLHREILIDADYVSAIYPAHSDRHKNMVHIFPGLCRADDYPSIEVHVRSDVETVSDAFKALIGAIVRDSPTPAADVIRVLNRLEIYFPTYMGEDAVDEAAVEEALAGFFWQQQQQQQG